MCSGIPHERTFELKAIGFIVQEVLFNSKSPPVLLEGLHAGRFITDNIPIFSGTPVTGQCQRDWTKLLRRNGDMVEEQCSARSQGEIFHFADRLPRAHDSERGFE